MGSGDDWDDDPSLNTLEAPADAEGGGGYAFAIGSGLVGGRTLGPYRLVRQLGEGAYAEVWLAVEQGEHGFQKQVALKILKDTAPDAAALDSLLNEARVCGMLHHVHIVDVYGVVQVEGLTFIAMEYVAGTTLEALMDRVAGAGLRLPLSVIVDIATGIAEALDHAHNATSPDGEPMRIVHRDLKPGNVMLAPGVGVKVADFGLAKATTNRNVTQVGQVRGTPGYIAPEVWAGTRDFTPGVDLWALGVMIWEMVVGEHLFDGTIMEVMGQAMNGDVDAEVGRLAAIRPRLAEVTRSLLKRRPEARAQSAWEIVVRLRELRGQLDAPGGLDLFLDLTEAANEERSGDRDVRRRVMTAQDPAWSQLVTLSNLSEHEQHQLTEARSEARRRRDETKGSASGTSPGKRTWFPGPRIGLPPEVGWGLLCAAIGLGIWGWSRTHGPDSTPAAVISGDPEEPEAPPGAGTEAPAAETPVAETPVAEAPVLAVTTPAVAVPEAPAPVAAVKRPAPAVVAVDRPAPEPDPTPQPEPTPQPAPDPQAAPAVGCLVFQSFPPGADVTVNGASSGLIALSGDATRRVYPSGPLTISMGSDDTTLATTTVQVTGGQRMVVRCDLIQGGACTVRSAEGSCD